MIIIIENEQDADYLAQIFENVSPIVVGQTMTIENRSGKTIQGPFRVKGSFDMASGVKVGIEIN